MSIARRRIRGGLTALTVVSIGTVGLLWAQQPQPNPQPPPTSFMPVVSAKSFEQVMQEDAAAKPDVQQRQNDLLVSRYDLSDKPLPLMMSGGRKAVQSGVRVRLPDGVTWDQLASMTPEEIKQRNVFPMGFRPLPHVKHATGGMVFAKKQIDAMREQEARDLDRFDAAFDLPEHLIPEFPPPIFLTTRPDLGDVSKGQLLSIKNY